MYSICKCVYQAQHKIFNIQCTYVLFSIAHSNLFTLFASLVTWQYTLPRNVYPNLFLELRIVFKDSGWLLSCSIFWSWTVVVSLSSCICLSTNSSTWGVILLGLPEPWRRPMLPVVLNFFRNFTTPLLQTFKLSSLNSFTIVVERFPRLKQYIILCCL